MQKQTLNMLTWKSIIIYMEKKVSLNIWILNYLIGTKYTHTQQQQQITTTITLQQNN